MTKSDVINTVSAKTGLSKKHTKVAVEAILETITESLVNKEPVSFIGFGTFITSERAARTAIVPGTDKTVNVPATTVARFKVGKALKVAVKG